MINTKQPRLKNLGEVEQSVMDYIWTHGPTTAESCREALAATRPMKDSTIRTVLRRLEEKRYVTHEVEGRTFVYKALDRRRNVADAEGPGDPQRGRDETGREPGHDPAGCPGTT